jgi:uncharacterized RDD family membrane protein YckC
MKPAVLKLLLSLTWLIALTARPGLAAPDAPAEAPAPAASAAPSPDPSPPRNLFAHGTDRQFWTAEVLPAMDPQDRVDHTLIRYRAAGEGKRWHAGDPLAGRAVALSTRGSELLVLMAGGDWSLVSESGTRAGNPLPGDLSILALAGDGETVWAVGDGSAVPQPPATRAATSVTSATAPTAANAAQALAPATASSSSATGPLGSDNLSTRPAPATRPHPLGLYRLSRGQWSQQTVLPDSVHAEDLLDITMIAADQRLLIALLERGRPDIRVLRFADGKWSDPAQSIARAADVAHLQLLDFRGRPILWSAGEVGPGEMFLGGGAAAGDTWSGPIALESSPKLSNLPRRALAVALGQIRLVCADGKGRVAEQVYDLGGKPVGAPIEGPASTGPMDVFLIYTLEIALAGLLLFVMLGSLRKREPLLEALRRREQLGLAALPQRFAAGVIDAFPMIIAVFILGRGGASSEVIRQRISSLSPESIWLCAALVLYLLHTTIFELIFRASIGKLLLGMRVVALSGERAPAGAIIMRNIMRIFDLLGVPLILVLVLPLRQRMGDIAAGTLVVRAAPRSDAPDRADNDS